MSSRTLHVLSKDTFTVKRCSKHRVTPPLFTMLEGRRAQFRWRNWRPSMRSCCKRRRPKSRPMRIRLDLDSPFSRTGHEWRTGLLATRWSGRRALPGGHQNPHGLLTGGLRCGVRALARALESAARRQTVPERVTIFRDAQAAIRRMAPEEPGLGRQYVLQARKHIAALRRARPGIIIKTR